MKISAVELKEKRQGIAPFHFSELGDIVLLTGSNGAGKTRLLKMIQKHHKLLHEGENADGTALQIELDGSCQLDVETAKAVQIINYSHYDARLQSPGQYAPYVIYKAKDILKKCDYEETALNSLLLIEDLAHGYSEEFRDGKKFKEFQNYARDFHIDIKYNKEKGLRIFGQDYDSLKLSPGQLYLLRMLTACFQNADRDDMIFFLDEPELHLHPSALIEMIEKLRAKFSKSQFWLSTHALSLVSYYSIVEGKSTTLYLKGGVVKQFRSDSSPLLDGLIGHEDNLYAMQQLFALPDQYACNQFTFECFLTPKALKAEKKGKADPQAELINEELLARKVIVDYGVGQGRFLEEWALCRELQGQKLEAPHYYGYDPFPTHAKACKTVMNKYSVPGDNYFNDIETLKARLAGQADYVLLVNVLHEIPVKDWCFAFACIDSLLCPDGKLIIVERDELAVGETAHEYGYMMLTSEAAKILFGGSKNVKEKRYQKKRHIVRYTVQKAGLSVDEEKVRRCIETIHQNSFAGILKINSSSLPKDRHEQYKLGAKKAFLLNQYANAALWIEDENRKKSERMLKKGG